MHLVVKIGDNLVVLHLSMSWVLDVGDNNPKRQLFIKEQSAPMKICRFPFTVIMREDG